GAMYAAGMVAFEDVPELPGSTPLAYHECDGPTTLDRRGSGHKVRWISGPTWVNAPAARTSGTPIFPLGHVGAFTLGDRQFYCEATNRPTYGVSPRHWEFKAGS